jgi:hypothetical protein
MFEESMKILSEKPQKERMSRKSGKIIIFPRFLDRIRIISIFFLSTIRFDRIKLCFIAKNQNFGYIL